MSPPSPSQRSHLPNPSTYGSGRSSSSRSAPPYTAPQPVRPTPYSSLGDALGGTSRQSQYMPSDAPYPPPPSSAGGDTLPPYQHSSSEGRYYYYTPSGVPSASGGYEYPHQSPPYDTPTQYSHSTLPPMRSASPASHLPPPQSSSHHTAPHTPYAPSFSQPQYTTPGIQQQWGEDAWGAPTTSSFSPDPTDVFAAGRSDPAHSPQPDVRSYTSQPYSSTPASARLDERAYNISPKSKGKARERDVAPSDRPPAGEMTPVPLDYSKLFTTYKDLFADCENFLTGRNDRGKRSSSVDDVDRLIRSANYGLRMLNNASPVASGERRLSGESLASAEPENPSPGPAPKRQVEATSNTEGQTCLGCGATSTPEWRRGPLGPRTLCNACGLVYAKLIKKRSREVGPSLGTPSQTHIAPQTSITEDAQVAMHSSSNEGSEDERYGQSDPA